MSIGNGFGAPHALAMCGHVRSTLEYIDEEDIANPTIGRLRDAVVYLEGAVRHLALEASGGFKDEPTAAPHDSADCGPCDDHADALVQADRDEQAIGGAL